MLAVKITFTHGNIVNICIVYKINLWERGYNDYFVLDNSLFGTAKLIKKADDIDKYKYSGYGIQSNRCRTFSVPPGTL